MQSNDDTRKEVIWNISKIQVKAEMVWFDDLIESARKWI